MICLSEIWRRMNIRICSDAESMYQSEPMKTNCHLNLEVNTKRSVLIFLTMPIR